MTDTLNEYSPDFSDLQPEPVPMGVPDHRASSGQTGERPRMAARSPFVKRGATAAPRGGKTRKVRDVPPPLKASAKKQIERIYILIGGFITPMNEILGETILESAPRCAESVFELAQTNEEFRRIVNSLMTGSLGGAVIFAHLPILLACVATISKSEKTKMIAGGTLVAMKMGANIDLSSLVPDEDESNTVD